MLISEKHLAMEQLLVEQPLEGKQQLVMLFLEVIKALVLLMLVGFFVLKELVVVLVVYNMKFL